MSEITILGIEKEIKKQEKDLAALVAKLVEAKQESPDKQLARELHDMLCTQNHTDGCGWFYEFDNKKDRWIGHAHTEFLKKAEKLTKACSTGSISVEQAIGLFKMVKGL